MKKFVILTSYIIQKNNNTKTLEKFYKLYYEYMKQFEVYHIINIIQSEYIKRYYTVYEIIDSLIKIIPVFVNNITFIVNDNLYDTINKMNLCSDENIFLRINNDNDNDNDNLNFEKMLVKFNDITCSSHVLDIEENFIDANYGIWKNLSFDEIRYNPRMTCNKGFFSCFAQILQILPYLNNKYFANQIFLNITYYSHVYGSYPNFNVFGNILQLNYEPSINKKISYNSYKHELYELYGIFLQQCGYQYDMYNETKNTDKLYSFKDNFQLTHDYLFKFFKFNNELLNKVEQFVSVFKNKKVLGLHFRGTDMLTVKWVQYITIDEFIKITEYHLSKNKYDMIFVISDQVDAVEKIISSFSSRYNIIFNNYNYNNNNKSIHSTRLDIIQKQIKNIKKSKDIIEKTKNEIILKNECYNNEIELKNVIFDSLVLSHCTTVIKTHSQVSAFSKIFNPNLEIYRVNGSCTGFFPDAYIPIYSINDIDNEEIKSLITRLTITELSHEKKFNYINMPEL